MRIAIVGCGVIGNRRAKALGEHSLVACADASIERAQALAALHPNCAASQDWREAATRHDVDAVIVSTTNDVLVPAALAAVQAGKHVLVEKPGARNAAELQTLADAVAEAKVVAKIGFNLRFHPALVKARQIVDAGDLGPLMFLRARYGHGGRLGMDANGAAIPTSPAAAKCSTRAST